MKLTPLSPNDIPTIQKWLGDEPLFRAVTSEAPDMAKPYYSFVVRLNDDTPVGWIDIFNVDLMHHKAEGGIALPERRGRGLSFRAGKHAIKFAFDDLGLHRLYLRIPSGNVKSIKLAEMMGFAKEGVEREAVFRNERYEDVIVYAIVNDRKEGE